MLTPADPQYALVPLVGRAVLAVLFLYVYHLRRERYLFYWAAGWTLLALHYLAHLLWVSEPSPTLLPPGVDTLLFAFGLLAFLDSARVFARGEGSPWWTGLLAPVFSLWVLVQTAAGGVATQVPISIGVGVVAGATGVYFWRESRRRDLGGGTILAVSFFLWALLILAAPLSSSTALSFTRYAAFLVSLPEQLVGVSMLIVFYQNEKRSLERSLLELTGFNLVTNTAQYADTLQEMIGQTLERLLAALHLPAGVMVLDAGGSQISIQRGDVGRFLHQAERLGLLPYLHHTVNRLGGLLVLPEVEQASAAIAFGRKEEFELLQRTARDEGVRMLVAASLRAKSGDQGLLLLASPESRRLAPAELRLLVGLGGQVGMAVENFQLHQQTGRRTEELRLLNEIGRALSSTLTVDELLTCVHAEIQKVLDANNFYVALYDSHTDEVTFALEVRDGHFWPKRQRRAGHGLTEHVLRTKEPLLIRENFSQTIDRLEVESRRDMQSFCAVPILLHGEPTGVIGMFSLTQEKAFDLGHVDILTILAAQMAVAMENARLFAGEQERARQLELLNNVSRRAISTLHPEEMLAAIAAELHLGLPYDHIGLGILDYETREVVIQVEAGHRAQGLNRRFKLGEGCVGQVAQSGTLRQVDNPQDARAIQPVLADAASVLCLPIVYGDQLLGVLNIESRQPRAFHDKDVLLLRTLADVVASALHNAFAFQKAQEQAITDGLTGVKTHRFFMEALSSEWRRSTRVSRPFSLALLDLDKFKFVNDYFGHLEGDSVLQRVGRVLEQNVRRSDVVARYGGDEFVILMPETNADQAYRLADKLRQWIANDPLLRERKITASIGLATFPQHAPTAPELIQISDAGMYLAKHQGGNVIVSADHYKMTEQKEWQRNVLEAYLGVTIKRLFATGPEAFDEVYHRLEQVIDSLGGQDESQELPAAMVETVTSLAFAIDAKDHYTQGHSQNVARYCTLVAHHLRLPDKEIEEIRLAAVLHDVGKIGIPERILNKPSALDPDEFEIMKEHAMLGAKILEPLRSIPRVQRIVRHHHERWDGGGYPDGLTGEEAPLGSRLIAIADAYDTMITERTYKTSLSCLEALEELERCAGAQFDPKLAKSFVGVVRKELSAEVKHIT